MKAISAQTISKYGVYYFIIKKKGEKVMARTYEVDNRKS